MKTILHCVLLLFVALYSNAQVVFQRTYGIGTYNEGRSVKQTLDGGYIIGGTVSDAGTGGPDVYLLKLDQFGTPQWNKLFGGSNIDHGYSVEQLSDSGYAIAGYTNSFGNGGYDGYLIRTDKNGDTLWTKTFGTSDWDFIYAMKKTSDGGFVLAGNSYGNVTGASEAWLLKTDALGSVEWEKYYDLNLEVFINAVSLSPDSAYVLAGYKINQPGNNEDMIVIKANSFGDTMWTQTIGSTTSFEHANAVDVNTNDSSIVAAGYSMDITSTNYDHYIVKLNSYGDVDTIQLYSQPGAEMINDIHSLANNFLIGGYTSSFGGGNKDTHYIMTDNMGNYLFGFTHGGASDDIAYHIEKTNDGGYILCGTSTSFPPGLQSVYVIKLDSAFQTSALVLGMNEQDDIISTSVNYPNPFHDFTIIVMDQKNPVKNMRLSVYSITGVKVFDSFPFSQKEIKFSKNDLPAGVYFYEIFDSEKKVSVGKLMIE